MIWIIHILLIIFFIPGLLISIPIHLILITTKDLERFTEWCNNVTERSNTINRTFDSEEEEDEAIARLIERNK